MDTGTLNRIITIQTMTITEDNGHAVEAWSLAETVRALVIQIDGSRYLSEDELIDKQVYKIHCWDNGYTDNIRIGYGNLNLIPIRPLLKNPGPGNLNEVTIIAATKASSI